MQWSGAFLTRRRRYHDLSVSVKEHLAEKIDELMGEGMSPNEAEQAACRAFGDVALIDNAAARYASGIGSRRPNLPSSPRAVIATLAIGIGAESTVCSVIHALLIDPYPYRDAMRMVHLHPYDKDPFPNDLGLTGLQFEESPDGFQFFGVAPQLGREFTPSDGVGFVLRSQAERLALERSMKEQVPKIDASQEVSRLCSATDEPEGDSLGPEKFAASLFTAFEFLALAFTVCGLYCVQPYLVAQRNRAIGVPLALGARRLHSIRLVTHSSFAAILVGRATAVASTSWRVTCSRNGQREIHGIRAR